jgi:acetyl-CoA carboxylase carboxyl transferase subunit beta
MAWWNRKKEKREANPAIAAKRSVPSGLWKKCEGCGAILESAKLATSDEVCPGCGYHFPLSTEARLRLLLDDGRFDEQDAAVSPRDPFGFRDTKRYGDRLRAAARSVGVNDAFREGLGRIDGEEVAIGCFVFEFMGGSMGSVVGEKIARLFERARERRVPAIVLSASGGARMQEGILSLMQMAKTTAALARLRADGVPYVSVLLHPTTGGVAASFAMLGDVILAEPRALIGFAGPRVIEQTIRQKLPEGFQRSEFLLQHGMIDAIVDRRELKARLAQLVRLLAPAPRDRGCVEAAEAVGVGGRPPAPSPQPAASDGSRNGHTKRLEP